MYQVKFTKLAEKQFLKLPKKFQKLCRKSINKLIQYPKVGEPLKGELKGFYKLRFSRYRIVYQLLHQSITIVIFKIRHRKDIYKKFRF
ncbi:type II toxin-antitoxin system RelE/ParE family toxin [Patescibacteria group bacterium]|nr:type II toxin-antitoxin system RelE/ParE family toxin [Patescibacteria group bacterium]MBU1457879.1 type II toxin-antitoxin system RelE/ParE family toxin [Patescibacteria group bacterium]